jgi:hypothetical protein
VRALFIRAVHHALLAVQRWFDEGLVWPAVAMVVVIMSLPSC